MYISSIDKKAYPIECLNMYPNWKFNNNDLLIKGIVLQNGIIYKEIEENIFMKIKVISVNKKIQSSMKIVQSNDSLEIVLNYDIIEKIN